MAPYHFTAAAARDVHEIYDFLVSRNEPAADRWIDELDRKAELYAGNPELGERCVAAADVRAFRVRRYVVYYRPYRDGIAIVRVIHSSRQVPPLPDE